MTFLAALEERYPATAYAVLPEVANATGHAASRTADALVVGFWPSRGMEIEGFEVKSARGDWLRELKDPSKAEVFFRYCAKWWMVETTPDIIKPDELPPKWGLLRLTNGKLKTLVKASPLEPETPKRMFWTSLIRSTVRRYGEKGKIDEAYRHGLADGEKDSKNRLTENEREITQLEHKIAELQRALSLVTGIMYAGPEDAEKYERMARFLLGGGYQRVVNNLTSAQQWIESFLKDPILPMEKHDA